MTSIKVICSVFKRKIQLINMRFSYNSDELKNSWVTIIATPKQMAVSAMLKIGKKYSDVTVRIFYFKKLYENSMTGVKI